jgi:hypothetical protein
VARLPGLGLARNAIAIVVLIVIVALGAFSLTRPSAVPGGEAIAAPTMAPGGSSPTPTPVAAVASALPASPSANPSLHLTTPPPTATPPGATQPPEQSPQPTETPLAYTNPDGPSPDDYPPDGYPFIEEARALPTFAGIWADENQRDFHIALTDDIEGAIAVIGADVPRGITVYFHLVEHSYAELSALRDAIFHDRNELMGKGIVLTFGGVSETEGRVRIGMSPISPEAIAYMQLRYPGPVDYEYGGGSALRPFTPPSTGTVRLIAVRDGEDQHLLTCGRRPFGEAALQSAGGAEKETGPAYDALREDVLIYAGIYSDLSSLTWLLAEKDEYGATFLARRTADWLEAPVYADESGRWAPGTIDDCLPHAFTASDYGEAEWSLDGDYVQPSATATELHVLVTERACSGASSPAGRLVAPIVTYEPDTVTMTLGVRPVGGPATCPGNPALPVTVVLPEPLGDRTLVGGAPITR